MTETESLRQPNLPPRGEITVEKVGPTVKEERLDIPLWIREDSPREDWDKPEGERRSGTLAFAARTVAF